MKLPNGAKAIVPYEKLEGYSLNFDHTDGRNKARVFRSALDITVDNSDILRERLLEVARSEDVIVRPPRLDGQGYEIRFRMVGPSGASFEVISGWFIDIGVESPRLTTCYIKL